MTRDLIHQQAAQNLPATADQGTAAARGAHSTGMRAARARTLHLGHFAFMRSVVQGVETRDSWDRYLRVEGEHDDIRNVRRTIQWIRDEFAAAAKRHDRFGTARLVQIDASRIKDDPAIPTLEEFAEEHGLLDFSEAEQLEQYHAHFGARTQRESRRARLIAKQLEAIAWLESLVTHAPPRAADMLATWLHPDLAMHLEAAGIYTLQQLADRINGLGMRWWSGIRAIGAVKAQRIMDWLRANQASTGLGLGAHVQVKRSTLSAHELARVVPPATAIVPLEKFVVPAELDGSAGLYRAPRHLNRIDAKNDYEAVLAWIKAKNGLSTEQRAAIRRKRGIAAREIDPVSADAPLEWLSYLSNTQRAYRKEAERFLLWAIVQHKKPLSSMTSEDCNAYLAFLADPTPAHRWCAPRSREKWSPLWRPYEGPLSPRAQRQAVTILKSLYSFLVDQCYLISNPWKDLSVPQIPVQIDNARSFTPAQWAFIEQQLELLSDTSANRRLAFSIHFLYATGLRLSEAVAAQVDHLNWMSYPADGSDDGPVEGWELAVPGKGETLRGVPVPHHVIRELSDYLASRGLHPDPKHESNRHVFLIGKAVDAAERTPWAPAAILETDPKAGIAPGTLYAQLKTFFTDCASVWAINDNTEATRLAAASTHWLRHTHGTHSAAAGTPLDVLQQTLGHASLSTTTIYANTEDRRRMKAMQAFWKKQAPRES